MKKIVVFFLAVLYLAFSSGLVMEIHHCMGRMSGISLLAAMDDHHTCAKCGMEKGANKCCRDEVKLVQLQDTQKPATAGFRLSVPFSFFIRQYPVYAIHAVSAVTFRRPLPHPPPAYAGTPRCILHGVFRI